MYEALHIDGVACVVDMNYQIVKSFSSIRLAKIFAAALNIIELLKDEDSSNSDN
jgi:hypothetical protein